MAGVEREETLETESCLRGSFKIGVVLHDVTLSVTSLSWTKSGDTASDAVCVPIEEIVCVRRKPGCTENTSESVTVCYITHKKKDVLRRETVEFQCNPETGDEWCQKLQDAISRVKERPHKLLVLVNPISGSGKGKKMYDGIAAEVFKQADIETDVIVTERPHHSEEILLSYNMTTVDGVVVVGGDGLYHETLNGLQRRLIKEAGLDENDSNSDLQPMPIPIGLIPAGTGNGTAAGCYGTSDVETAALAIIISKKRHKDIVGVHSKGELIGYSCLIVGYGFWGDIIYNAETRRYLGILRYPVSLADTILIKSQRHLDLSIEYVPPLMSKSEDQDSQPVADQPNGDQPTENKDTDGQPIKTGVTSLGDSLLSENTTENKMVPDTTKATENVAEKDLSQEEGPSTSGTDWKRRQGIYSGLFITIGVFKSAVNEMMVPLEDNVRLVLNHPCGRFQMLQFMVKVLSQESSSSLDNSIVEHMLVKEFRVKLNNPSHPESDDSKREHVINIDGEICPLKHPVFTVRNFEKLEGNVQ